MHEEKCACCAKVSGRANPGTERAVSRSSGEHFSNFRISPYVQGIRRHAGADMKVPTRRDILAWKKKLSARALRGPDVVDDAQYAQCSRQTFSGSVVSTEHVSVIDREAVAERTLESYLSERG